ncbi:MAG TPA: hypothetical protein EYP25_14280 [Anaerolineae bacterium]|nr:hypothetical protein [Anaerolineae bacterium]
MSLSKRLIFLAFILLLFGSALAACGGEPVPVKDTEADFVLALPRFVVDIDENGMPTVAGFSPELLALLGVDVKQFAMDPEIVNWFTQANVQHIELVQKDDGIYVFVNGVLMPHLGWNTEDLQTMTDAMTKLGVIKPEFQMILRFLVPFIQHTGLDVALRFPMQPTAEEIPLRDIDAPIESVAVAEDVAPMAVVKARVTFDEMGAPSILGLSTRDLAEAGLVGLRNVGLAPETLQKMKEAGISKVTIQTTPNGIIFWINDEQLPYIVWNDEYLNRAADLYAQLYFMPQYELQRELVKTILPALARIEGEVTFEFPH